MTPSTQTKRGRSPTMILSAKPASSLASRSKPGVRASAHRSGEASHGSLAGQKRTFRLVLHAASRGRQERYELERRAQSRRQAQSDGDEARRTGLLLSFERRQGDRRHRRSDETLLSRSNR